MKLSNSNDVALSVEVTCKIGCSILGVAPRFHPTALKTHASTELSRRVFLITVATANVHTNRIAGPRDRKELLIIIRSHSDRWTIVSAECAWTCPVFSQPFTREKKETLAATPSRSRPWLNGLFCATACTHLHVGCGGRRTRTPFLQRRLRRGRRLSPAPHIFFSGGGVLHCPGISKEDCRHTETCRPH